MTTTPEIPASGVIALGVDIGGTGMKAAPVRIADGTLVADRHRIPTPRPATPAAVAEVVGELVSHFGWTGPVGVALPSVVRHGIVRSAANIVLDRPVTVLNDADAAGLAEMAHGAGRGRGGVVIMLTFGTGIGSALFVDGHLVPNTELGHLEFRGESIERWAAASARERDDLDWSAWAARVNDVLAAVERLFSPDLIILGGGVSKKAERWVPHLVAGCEVAVAHSANSAGIVGAAMAAAG